MMPAPQAQCTAMCGIFILKTKTGLRKNGYVIAFFGNPAVSFSKRTNTSILTYA
jgi:hypothetical protein